MQYIYAPGYNTEVPIGRQSMSIEKIIFGACYKFFHVKSLY